MASRQSEPSPATLSLIQSTSSQTAGVPDEPADFTALLAVAERMLGTWDGVGDRLCREVAALTRQRARLRLHPVERTRGVRSESPSGAHLHPVQFAGRLYGTLVVAPDSQDPAVPALPDMQAQRLACICGVVLCLYEQAALLRVLCHHLAPEPTEPLTRRQREVLTLISRGLSDDEIAETLHISPNTLQRHCYDMCARLGVHAADDLLLVAYQYGLVSNIVSGT